MQGQDNKIRVDLSDYDLPPEDYSRITRSVGAINEVARASVQVTILNVDLELGKLTGKRRASVIESVEARIRAIIRHRAGYQGPPKVTESQIREAMVVYGD